jgi:UDP-N-acetyl-2-amino-2-deoxyglucuronate dehydrogenase
MTMLRIAVVGVGWAGRRHVEAIRELDRKLTVIALVDSDADHLHTQATELGIDQTYTEYEAALADPAIDAVSLCTPHASHCPMALQAAAAGKHILVEKPMALTVAEATQMIAAANRHDVRLYVAENESYTPMARFLRQLVQTGEPIGELTTASFVGGFRGPNYGYPGRRAWLGEPVAGGTGTWMLHGIHSMAQLRYIFAAYGEVETVYMVEHKAGSFARRDVEGTMSGLLTLVSGLAVSVVQTAESKLYGNLGGYVLHGDRGSVRASRQGCELFTDDHADPPLQISYPQVPLSDYAQEMEAFADYVNGVATGPTTGASERRSLAIVQAGYESAASGRPLDLRKRFGEL